jgi:2-polyprenyl-3-methyl-5-hydroxy-6-metoxy-1,4-benzoquinol methylase
MSGLYDACHKVGGMTADYWERDPKRLAFVLARYKFAARMLEGKARVLEVGCADGFGSRIVRQHVGELTAVDIDPASIEEARVNDSRRWPVRFWVHDIMAEPLPGFDAVYCLDVFEHIEDERKFLANLRACAPVAVIGTPSLESQAYASELSRKGHVNCKRGPDLKRAIEQHWKHVFMFSMSDEVVHTGFQPMAHYLIALAVA